MKAILSILLFLLTGICGYAQTDDGSLLVKTCKYRYSDGKIYADDIRIIGRHQNVVKPILKRLLFMYYGKAVNNINYCDSCRFILLRNEFLGREVETYYPVTIDIISLDKQYVDSLSHAKFFKDASPDFDTVQSAQAHYFLKNDRLYIVCFDKMLNGDRVLRRIKEEEIEE